MEKTKRVITIENIGLEELLEENPEEETDKKFLKTIGVTYKGILDVAWHSITSGHPIAQEEFYQTFLQEFSETICQLDLDQKDAQRLYEIFRGSCTVIKSHRRKYSSEETKQDRGNVTVIELTKTSKQNEP